MDLDANINNQETVVPLTHKDHHNKYQERWESRGSIRTRPRKTIDFSQKGYFFPSDKQTLLLNQDVVQLGEEIKEKILLQSCYKYLNDIVTLEIMIFVSICNKLIYSDLVVKYDDNVKLNVHTIIIDEYYHAYVAKDMILQLTQHYNNLEKFNYQLPDSYNAVQLIKNRLDQKYQDIFEIIAVCIFETTLVRELVEFFNSGNVHPSIRHYVNDHMNDEARHYGFFCELLEFTWAKLPDDYKENIGQQLASFIKLYLNVNSEKAFNLELLKYLLQDEKKATSVINALYQGFDITPEIPIVKNVINVLRKSKLLDDRYVKESFRNIGWDL